MLMRDIAQALSAELVGNGDLNIERIVPPGAAMQSSDLAVALSGDAVATLASTKAHAVVVSRKHASSVERFESVIVTDQGRTALATLTVLFDGGPARQAGVHETAVVAPDAVIGDGASIGPYAVIGSRSRIGARTSILPHVSIGSDVAIGADGLIHSGVRIGDGVLIGDRVLIQFNAAIGCDGFSFAPELGPHTRFAADVTVQRVHSVGTVIIGDDVDIGAGTTIDRATLEATRIGRGTKIDNHVHIAHNVTIGEHCLICGMVGISGSVTIGDRVRLGGGVGVSDHTTIGTDAVVAAGSGVASHVPEGGVVSGYPAMPHERTLEIIAYLLRQKRLWREMEDLKVKVEALRQSKVEIKAEPQ